MQGSPWPESEQGKGVDRPNLAALVACGEGGEAGEVQGVTRYLLEGLGRGGGDWRWVVDDEQRRSEHGIDGEGALVGSGRGGEVYELREDEAKLMVGSAWAERLRRCGATVSFELACVQMDGDGVLGSGGGELAKEQVD